MIPQMAHSRHGYQPYGPKAAYGDGGAPFDSINTPRMHDALAPLPFRNSRESQQRTWPAESRGPRRPASGNSYDPSEHMLRRKTPNGTLAAGYDGTPVHWSTKAPALKHVALPVGGSSNSTPPALLGENGGRRRISSTTWNHQSKSQLGLNTGLELRPNSVDRASWSNLPSFSITKTPMDNASMHQPTTFYPHHSTQIPTVLQPVYQPSAGPTASNDGGFYGPYWPDGRFVPYRPAAFTDQAHFHPGNEVNLDRSFQQLYNSHQYSAHSQGQALNFNGQSGPRNGEIYPYIEGNAPLQENNYTLIQSQPMQPDLSLNPPFSSSSRTPTAPSAHKARIPHFKERTLAWAHSIYIDLLTSIHQSKKDTRQSKQSNGIKSNLRSAIFPKPPRQPASKFGGSQWSQPYATEGSYGVESGSAHGCRVNDLVADSHNPTIDASFGVWQGFPEHNCTRHGKVISQDGAHYVSPFQIPHTLSSSPLAKAKDALEVLTTLCEQSGWCWIDGMLLGGCLAYRLEEFQQALEWYSKILILDPKHVEAISNLAATLLCLERPEEAKQHWLQAVKLRPSYFEAVEHLIGLLCMDHHRSKEAVNIIDFVERSLRLSARGSQENSSQTPSNAGRESHDSWGTSTETVALDHDHAGDSGLLSTSYNETTAISSQLGFGSSGFSVPGSENGRILALIHAKGNMLYALGDVNGASKAFEDAVLISAGKDLSGIQELIQIIVHVLSNDSLTPMTTAWKSPTSMSATSAPLLLPPDKALQTARLVFATNGELPGLRYVPEGLAKKAAVSTTSNSLLSLAKIFQDAMSSSTSSQRISRMPTGVGDILALYYLSLSLAPSPSTANNVGILLASVHHPPSHRPVTPRERPALPPVPGMWPAVPGVHPGSGVALALAYYNYGLNLDEKHAHLYTNLGSLLKDLGQLSAAIRMYEQAVIYDSTFDIALANLANAVKDQGRTSDAIQYYRRAVAVSPDFAEAVCGLANALNSVCSWGGRGGVVLDGGQRDRWHVDDAGMITDARSNGNGGGWMKRVVEIVGKQLRNGSSWGLGTLHEQALPATLRQLEAADSGGRWPAEKRAKMRTTLGSWAGHRWEGARLVRLIERAIKRAMHRWFEDQYIKQLPLPASSYPRPQFPANLPVPPAPTVLPFHTFTCPLSAKEIRMISQRNALRISCSTLRAPWMQGPVFRPPAPPAPHLNIGYVSSDFNNHPLAHLMQSVFGFHNPAQAKAFCYATTASDKSIHRQQIEREAPVFRDVHAWALEQLVQQIVDDGIHILVNLNGYTRGARNEIFAARPAPIQMSFMGFAGTLGAEWCDYILADEIAIPPETLRPWRRNLDLEDQILDEQYIDEPDWMYSENIIFCRDTFFCCDHAQSDPRQGAQSWDDEQSQRWKMRKELFPSLSDDAIILGNFNQLYKIEPTTFRTWLRILDKVPKAILWLLRFPDLGESNLKRTAYDWAGESVASRIWFTDVAPKHEHISRARVCDLFLDTPECNAHTTAADVLWSSTPLLTLPRYDFKMCSRMAASILRGALPQNAEGHKAAAELIAKDDEQYEEFAVRLATGFSYQVHPSGYGVGSGRLAELRKLLHKSKWSCALFDTKRWVRDLESAYKEAWRRWANNEGGDIYISELPNRSRSF